MSVKSAAVFKSLCRLGFKVDLSISRDIHQAIEHTILWEEMNALVSERFRVSFSQFTNICFMRVNKVEIFSAGCSDGNQQLSNEPGLCQPTLSRDDSN